MDMNFNFNADCTEVALGSPRLSQAREYVSPWLVAEIHADIAEELARRRIAQNDR